MLASGSAILAPMPQLRADRGIAPRVPNTRTNTTTVNTETTP